jgi:ribosomal-protein-alanine N-acetyltransferase
MYKGNVFTMSNLILRAATAEDIAAVHSLERICFTDAWSEGMLLSSLTDGVDFTLLLDGETLIGYSIVDRRVQGEAELHNVAIIPEYRGKGLSSLLMDKMISDCAENGVSVIFLEVRENNAPAINLYKKYGFTAIDKRKNYYKNPTEDAWVMMKSL